MSQRGVLVSTSVRNDGSLHSQEVGHDGATSEFSMSLLKLSNMSSKDRNVGLGLPLSNFVILDVSDVINVSSTIFYFRTTYAVHCSIFRMKSLHDC